MGFTFYVHLDKDHSERLHNKRIPRKVDAVNKNSNISSRCVLWLKSWKGRTISSCSLLLWQFFLQLVLQVQQK